MHIGLGLSITRRFGGNPLAAYAAGGKIPDVIAQFAPGTFYLSPNGNEQADILTGTDYDLTAAGLYAENGDLPRLLNAALSPLDFSGGITVAIDGTITYVDAGSASQAQFLSSVYSQFIQMLLDTSGGNTGKVRLLHNSAAGTVTVNSTNELTPGTDVAFRVAGSFSASEAQVALNGIASAASATSAMPNFLGTIDPLFGRPQVAGTTITTTLVRVWADMIGEAGLVEATTPFDRDTTSIVDVVALFGQSNMAGRASYDSGTVHPAKAYQWTEAGALAAAAIPMGHPGLSGTDYMGPDVTFAQDYLAAYPGHSLVFIPYGPGSTGFAANNWNSGDATYVAAVAKANAAMAYLQAIYERVNFKGILWLQGEQDCVVGTEWTQLQYSTAFDAMATAMRAAITGASAAPIVLGQIPDLGASFPTENDINAAILDTPNRDANTAVAANTSLTKLVDGLHYDAASQRTMGSRMYAALATLL